MKLLIDIGHAKDVHTFKNVAIRLRQKGNKVIFFCRDRENVIYLLKYYGFEYYSLGFHYKGLIAKILGLVKYDIVALWKSVRIKPDMLVSHSSIILGHVSWLLRIPHIALEDTYNMEQVSLSIPFENVILTGDYPHRSLGRNEIRYPGYHELAYLHPNVFHPNETTLDLIGINKKDKFVIIRFVAWNATHDFGHKGMFFENKIKLINSISQYVKVLISSESELPSDLQSYQINIRPERMHDALAFAHFFIGESSTMAAESACLGTPSIYINSSQLGYIKNLSKYELIHTYTESAIDQEKAILKAVELAQLDDIKSEFTSRRQNMLKDKIDVTAFLEWFIENYPNSGLEMRASSFDFNRFR